MDIDSNELLNIDSHDFTLATQRVDSKTILLWAFCSLLFYISIFLFNPSLMIAIDLKRYDLLLKNLIESKTNSINNSSKIIDDKTLPVIIDLDEKSLRKYGQWPWSRYKVAELLDKTSAMKPAVIALDMIFAEPDRTSVNQLLQELVQTYQIENLRVENLPPQLFDNDIILADTLDRGNFVLGDKFHFESLEKSSEPCKPIYVKTIFMNTPDNKIDNLQILKANGVLCNLSIFTEKVKASGFLNFRPDKDGMLRRIPLLIEYNGSFYPGLALATVLKFKGIDTILLKQTGGVLKNINYKDTTVPVDPYGQMFIKFKGPKKSYKYISAADIMDNTISPETLKGRIVFIGTSADGLKEVRTTPCDPIFPGVEVHATIVDNMLNKDFISIPDWYNSFILLLIAALILLLSLVIAYSGSVMGFFVMFIFIAGLWMLTESTFVRMGLFIGTAFPMVSIVCHYIFITALKYRMEEKKMILSMQELLLTQDVTIESMANLTEYKDSETGGHIKRTRIYVRLLAQQIKKRGKYKNSLTDADIDMLYKSAPLHDIGKVGIPDSILRKKSSLTAEEFDIMKRHPAIGRDVIEASVQKLQRLGKSSFLSVAAQMAHSHQEKWDGSGYPQGLKGEEIPFSGRIMALADVYDALISKRVYKAPFPHSKALEIIKQGRGTHFDPDIVDAFLEVHEQFREIARKFADSK